MEAKELKKRHFASQAKAISSQAASLAVLSVGAKQLLPWGQRS